MSEARFDAAQAWASASEAETAAYGAELAERLLPDGILLLTGEMGSGKTVLVRGLAQALGVADGEVQSPSYSLIHEHLGRRGRLVHIDLYRLDPHEVEALGVDELLAGPGIKAIEWPDRLPFEPPAAWRLEIARTAGGRQILLRGALD